MMRIRSVGSIDNHLFGGFKFKKWRLLNKPVLNLFTILVFMVILFFLPSSIFAETFVSGNITQDTTWTPAGSPYIVTGDVTVRYSSPTWGTNVATLTLNPGVEVRFEPGTGIYVGKNYSSNEYDYYGALSARGTADNPIVFTSNAATPSPGDWKGIYFREQTDDSKSLLEYCVVEYGGSTSSSKRNIYCESANPTIKNNTVRYSSGPGILLVSSSTSIENNTIIYNGQDGIYSDDTSYASISGNIIAENVGAAINVHPNSTKKVRDNSGSGNSQNYIKIRGGAITSNAAWVKLNQGSLPYVITGDVTVRYSSPSWGTTVATLTLNPGVELRFEPGTGIYVGKNYASNEYDYYGALSAQGTPETPIIFTSNAASPAPGDWKGIRFQNQTIDADSLLEHCIVEYGGYTTNANIYLANARPTIQYNTIRNSSHSGIYVSGTGANGSTVSCNNLKDNMYGVYTADNAQPLVNNNNFLRNQLYGIYNADSVIVDAKDNWWGDVDGPGVNGDDVYGNVDDAPWLAAESNCIDTPPTNSPPFEPTNPDPADGVARIPVITEELPVTVTLNWTGGDPNPWDTVVYDVYFGNSPGGLVKLADSIISDSFDKADLTEGISYYWQIIARDDVGAETGSPVWSFTTLGPPPDLVINQIEWDPLQNLAAGQEIFFTATVENIGSGPVVDVFQVDFKIDGTGIGSKTVDLVIPAAGTTRIVQTWTARTGDFSIEVIADSTGTVVESLEDNNNHSAGLP